MAGLVFIAERSDYAARGSIHGDKGYFIGKAQRGRGTQRVLRVGGAEGGYLLSPISYPLSPICARSALLSLPGEGESGRFGVLPFSFLSMVLIWSFCHYKVLRFAQNCVKIVASFELGTEN